MMFLPHGLVGVAAWQCANCGRVESTNVQQVSYVCLTPPRCYCQHDAIWLMSPLNRWAEHIVETASYEMRMASLQAKAARCMQEVNW